MDTFYIDVREIDEFESGHIEGSLNAPLSKFENFIEPAAKLAESFNLVIVCKSGVRSGKALNILKKKHSEISNVEVLDGGVDKWQKEGKGLIKKENSSSLTIIRQVMIVAGCLVLIGSLGSLFLKYELIWLAVFVGAGLTFAGVSGICFMAKLLALMPWNK